MKIGTQEVTSLSLGGGGVDKVMLGSNPIYTAETPVVLGEFILCLMPEDEHLTFQYKSGMTWEEFISSSYNDGNFKWTEASLGSGITYNGRGDVQLPPITLTSARVSLNEQICWGEFYYIETEAGQPLYQPKIPPIVIPDPDEKVFDDPIVIDDDDDKEITELITRD